MVSIYRLLYQDLLNDLKKSQESEENELKKIELGFEIADKYLALVTEAEGENFDSAADRVEFFKYIKPLFLAEFRYLKLYYYAVMFRPTNSIQDLKRFWVRESNRFSRYTEESKDFYDYYTRQETERDLEFFGGDSLDADLYGGVIADFIALERYKAYMEKEWNNLMSELE